MYTIVRTINAHLNNMVTTIVDETNTMPSLTASTVNNDTYLQVTRLLTEPKNENWNKCIQMEDSRMKINMK